MHLVDLIEHVPTELFTGFCNHEAECDLDFAAAASEPRAERQSRVLALANFRIRELGIGAAPPYHFPLEILEAGHQFLHEILGKFCKLGAIAFYSRRQDRDACLAEMS
ncbi:MAG: hypothetical protein ACFHX7_11380 [Pseudomonadota bacterium]